VDLPVPEGPDRTIGRSFDDEFCGVGAIVQSVLIVEIEEETTRVRECEFDNESLEAIWCKVEVTLGLTENLKLEGAQRLVFRWLMKLWTRKLWEGLM
jgi:hypothetical protein